MLKLMQKYWTGKVRIKTAYLSGFTHVVFIEFKSICQYYD